MVEKYITGTLMDDPEWITELFYFLKITDKKETVFRYKKQFKDTYLTCIYKGLSPKEALEKAKNIVLCFKNK